MKLKDILDNTDAPIFVRASLKNAVETKEIQEPQTSQTVGLLSETVFANDVVFDHNISYPEYYRAYRECSVDVITVDNYITDKITESNIPYLDVTIFLYFSHEAFRIEGLYTVSSESVAEAVSRSTMLSNLLDKDGKPAAIELKKENYNVRSN